MQSDKNAQPGPPLQAPNGSSNDSSYFSEVAGSARPVMADWERTNNVSLRLLLRGSFDLAMLFASALFLLTLLFLRYPIFQIPFGLLLVLFAPGYALVAAIFPKRSDIDLAMCVGLSFGLSIATIPTLALALDLTTIGITPMPVLISLAAWIAFWASIALWRRQQAGSRYLFIASSADSAFREIVAISRIHRRLAFTGLFAGLLLTIGVAAFHIADNPDPSTEFYVLGAEGEARDYPRAVKMNTPVLATIGIKNREKAAVSYRVEVWTGELIGTRLEHLATELGPIEINSGSGHEENTSWHMPASGNDKSVTFLLYRDENSEPHRQLQLFVDVSERSADPTAEQASPGETIDD